MGLEDFWTKHRGVWEHAPLGPLGSVLRLFLGYCCWHWIRSTSSHAFGRYVCMQLLSIRDSKLANDEDGVWDCILFCIFCNDWEWCYWVSIIDNDTCTGGAWTLVARDHTMPLGFAIPLIITMVPPNIHDQSEQNPFMSTCMANNSNATNQGNAQKSHLTLHCLGNLL